MAFFNTDELKKKAQEFYNKFFAKLKEEVEQLKPSQIAKKLEEEKERTKQRTEVEEPSLKEKVKTKVAEAREFIQRGGIKETLKKQYTKEAILETIDPLKYPKQAVKTWFYDPKIGVFPQFLMREGMAPNVYRLANWKNLSEKERKEELEKSVMPIIALSGAPRATVSPGSRAYKQIIKEGWFRKKIDKEWAWVHPGGEKVVREVPKIKAPTKKIVSPKQALEAVSVPEPVSTPLEQQITQAWKAGGAKPLIEAPELTKAQKVGLTKKQIAQAEAELAQKRAPKPAEQAGFEGTPLAAAVETPIEAALKPKPKITDYKSAKDFAEAELGAKPTNQIGEVEASKITPRDPVDKDSVPYKDLKADIEKRGIGEPI